MDLLQNEKLNRFLPRLREEAEWYEENVPGLNHAGRVKVWDAHRPCAFLGADQLCGTYERRPVVCRSYFVVTDPALCAAGEAATVGIIDTLDVQLHQLEWARKVSEPGLIGPLPNLVLFALQHLRPEQKDIADACSKLRRSIEDWTLSRRPEPA